MIARRAPAGGASGASPATVDVSAQTRRHVAWFHELDAWTEYWDVYHPESRGRYYFGNDADEPGLLGRFLPRQGPPPAVFVAWMRLALGQDTIEAFRRALRLPPVAAAVREVDTLVARLFAKHFGAADDPAVQADYLTAIFAFATDTLPPAAERDARIADDDPRKPTAGRHTLDGDMMWFAWALHTEAAFELAGADAGQHRRALMLAGIAYGCPINFAWRGHRRTRPEYRADAETAALLLSRARQWAHDFEAARQEVRALFRIREWGHAD